MTRLRISGHGHGKNTTVWLDDILQTQVTDVKLEMSVNCIPSVTITYLVTEIEIDVEAEAEGLKDLLASLD